MKCNLFSAVIFCALALAGCAKETITQEMGKLTGQPVDKVFAKIGFPDGEQTIRGQRIYFWNNSESFTFSSPKTAIANVGTSTGYETVTIRTSEDETISGDCRLRVFVDENDIVTNHDVEGATIACEEFASSLQGTPW